MLLYLYNDRFLHSDSISLPGPIYVPVKHFYIFERFFILYGQQTISKKRQWVYLRPLWRGCRTPGVYFQKSLSLLSLEPPFGRAAWRSGQRVWRVNGAGICRAGSKKRVHHSPPVYCLRRAAAQSGRLWAKCKNTAGRSKKKSLSLPAGMIDGAYMIPYRNLEVKEILF